MKIFKFIFFVSLGILILTSIKVYFFSEWTFTNRLNYNLFWSFQYSSFVLMIFSFTNLITKNQKINLICGIIAMLISALIFKLQFNPIDTNKYPIDRKILSENDNSKIVIREKK